MSNRDPMGKWLVTTSMTSLDSMSQSTLVRNSDVVYGDESDNRRDKDTKFTVGGGAHSHEPTFSINESNSKPPTPRHWKQIFKNRFNMIESIIGDFRRAKERSYYVAFELLMSKA